MTPDVRIRRLNLKVVQRGGPWLGRDELKQTGELARRAVLADLDDILARALAGYAGDERLEKIELDLTLDEPLSGRVVPMARPRLRAQLAAALEHAAAAALREQRQAAPRPDPAAREGEAKLEIAFKEEAHDPEQQILALLLAWHAEGRLAQRLKLIPAATMARWLDLAATALERLPMAPAARAQADQGDAGVTPQDQGISEVVGLQGLPPDPGAMLEALVVLAAQWSPFRPPASRLGALRGAAQGPNDGRSGATDSAVVADAHADQLAAGIAARSVPDDDADASTAALVDPARVTLAPSAPEIVTARLPARCAIRTALPFLLLGPLARIGWLDAASAVLAERDTAQHAPALGYALALKALPVPERTWRHAPDDLAAASFAAGLATQPHGDTLARLNRALRADFPVLDSVLADVLVQGHRRHAPLAVVALQNSVVLVEPDGLFPLAIGTDWRGLAPVARAAGAPLLLDPALPGSICAEIDDAGVTFVAPGTPIRGERWHAIAGRGSWRGMTNAVPELWAALIEAATQQGGVIEDARAMLQALGPARPLAPGLDASALHRSVTLAAALALGEIAWRLAAIDPTGWAHPDPVLALERFGDLSATMIVTENELEIRLPIGPRSRDLAAADLLADVAATPWLDRRLRFGIG